MSIAREPGHHAMEKEPTFRRLLLGKGNGRIPPCNPPFIRMCIDVPTSLNRTYNFAFSGSVIAPLFNNPRSKSRMMRIYLGAIKLSSQV